MTTSASLHPTGLTIGCIDWSLVNSAICHCYPWLSVWQYFSTESLMTLTNDVMSKSGSLGWQWIESLPQCNFYQWNCHRSGHGWDFNTKLGEASFHLLPNFYSDWYGNARLIIYIRSTLFLTHSKAPISANQILKPIEIKQAGQTRSFFKAAWIIT